MSLLVHFWALVHDGLVHAHPPGEHQHHGLRPRLRRDHDLLAAAAGDDFADAGHLGEPLRAEPELREERGLGDSRDAGWKILLRGPNSKKRKHKSS